MLETLTPPRDSAPRRPTKAVSANPTSGSRDRAPSAGNEMRAIDLSIGLRVSAFVRRGLRDERVGSGWDVVVGRSFALLGSTVEEESLIAAFARK